MSKKIKIILVVVIVLLVAISLLAYGYYFPKSILGTVLNSVADYSNKKPLMENNNAITENLKPTLLEPVLSIPKISLSAPIILDVDGGNQDLYIKSLENGVAHMKYSAKPGEKGNSIIFGHSSYYADKPGRYKEIFVKLNDLVISDEINIFTSNTNKVTYKISSKNIVDPKKVEILDQNTKETKLTIVTCWPVGTVDQRLVVSATKSD